MAITASGIWLLEYGLSPVCRLGGEGYLVQNAVLFCAGCRHGIHHGRQHNLAGTRLRHPPKKHQEQEGLGRSCGGFSTKIHAVCEALGLPIDFIITPGQSHDAPQAIPLIENLSAQNLLADKGYDSDNIRDFAIKKGIAPHILTRSNRLEERHCDRHLYKERHKIECMFGFLKHYRRIFSRFDKLKRNFQAFLHFVAALQWLK